jgi:hypothetical protein
MWPFGCFFNKKTMADGDAGSPSVAWRASAECRRGPEPDDVTLALTLHGWRQWRLAGVPASLLLAVVTLLSCATRLYRLEQPATVACVLCVYIADIFCHLFNTSPAAAGMRPTLASLPTSTCTGAFSLTCTRHWPRFRLWSILYSY